MTTRRKDSGFALLLVFAMASVVAIALYYSMPRAAFEAERDKEQTLIDRGEQYKRAIQLYVRKNKSWPAKIEDLESNNGVRYLRRRYLDPMTGKGEWRAVHVGPNGVLTDSLIKPKSKKDEKAINTFITELQPIGGGPDQGGPVNLALRKRPSEQAAAGQSGDPGMQPGSIITGGQPPPNLSPPYPSAPNSSAPNPSPSGQQTGQNSLTQQLQQPGGAGTNGRLDAASSGGGGISVLGAIGSTGAYSTAAGANGSTPAPGATQMAGQTAAQGGQAGAAQGANQNNAAATLIGNLLTSPRPGGAPPGISGGSPAGGVTGGGIAGYATKFEGSAIKRYNDQDEYQKWEFVYDMSKDAAVTGGAQNQIPQPPGPNTPQSQSGFGQSNGTNGTQTNGTGMGAPVTAPTSGFKIPNQ